MTLNDLQNKLKAAKLDAYLLTRNNMFIRQDLRDDENLIQQLTGFSGSDGTLLILRNHAILFVDGRYELQAPLETNPKEVEIFCTKNCSFHQWLEQNTLTLKRFRLGINPWCLTEDEKNQLCLNQISLHFCPDFLPPLLSSIPAQVFEHKMEYAGEASTEKLSRVISVLKQSQADAIFLSLADDVSWLFNLRSNALPETPILRAMALVSSQGDCWLFGDNLDTSQVQLNFPLLPLKDIPQILHKFKKKSILLSPSSNATALFRLLEEYSISLCQGTDIIQAFKAIKNPIELSGIRQAHLRDGIAVTKFIYWLTHNRRHKTEMDIVNKLHHYRTLGNNFFSESFTTIAASGPNGAIVHYHPSLTHNRPLDDDSMLLLDSGAQYFDGTTDVTRTLALGHPSPSMIEDYTLVLKSHISLCSAVFPQNISGGELDMFAREVLWKEGKEYHHGTGHGVGCFLNVHEGPQRIARQGSSYPLSAGMITSIEPGFYLENQYGIRIENLVEIIFSPEHEGYLQFSPLTLIPLEKNLINKYLLSDDEINWVNQYHQRVLLALQPYLTSAENQWLEDCCAPL